MFFLLQIFIFATTNVVDVDGGGVEGLVVFVDVGSGVGDYWWWLFFCSSCCCYLGTTDIDGVVVNVAFVVPSLFL
jgi:hypothetical protein